MAQVSRAASQLQDDRGRYGERGPAVHDPVPTGHGRVHQGQRHPKHDLGSVEGRDGPRIGGCSARVNKHVIQVIERF